MSKEPVDQHFGIPMSEWIVMLSNELEHDLVFLAQIIPAGKESFALQGEELVDFVRRCFLSLLEKGGKFCVGSIINSEWTKIALSNAKNEELTELIIDAWQNSTAEPDWYEFWFDIPTDKS